MDIEKLLNQILRKYGKGVSDSTKLAAIAEKVAKGAAKYPDAQKYAIETGKVLTSALREYLPEALTDGRLYRAIAEVLVQQPIEQAGADVARIAEAIQEGLNQAAGVGLKAIVPEMNEDQITGIITGICNADSYESNVELFMDQVSGLLEGYVDDFVRENAGFQYEAGLSPTVERIADGGCCKWCSSLAGSYDYASVRDRGNDVWRRHNNCHCQIIYNPAGSKRRR